MSSQNRESRVLAVQTMNSPHLLFIFVFYLSLVSCRIMTMSNYKNIGFLLPPNTQASGIALLEDGLSRRIAVANDEGFICLMNLDGTNVTCQRVYFEGIVKMDLEDICLVRKVYQERGTIFLALEFPPAILEYHVRSNRVIRKLDISQYVPATKKHGLESLAFVPNATSPFGGVFYAGTQQNGYVYKFEVSSNITESKVNFIGSFDAQVGSTDLAGMYYHEENKFMYVVVDKLSHMFSINHNYGGIIDEWEFDVPPVTNPEGIFITSINNVSTLLIADDIGTVFVAEIELDS